MKPLKVISSLPLFLGFNMAFATPSYTGYPETDKYFPKFIANNVGKVVQITAKFKASSNNMIEAGYKGNEPSFDGAKLNGVDYSFFIDCEPYQKPDADSAIGRCGALATWEEATGTLKGSFKIKEIFKTNMKNYRGVRLVPVNSQ